jgi:hypothetical protein
MVWNRNSETIERSLTENFKPSINVDVNTPRPEAEGDGSECPGPSARPRPRIAYDMLPIIKDRRQESFVREL